MSIVGLRVSHKNKYFKIKMLNIEKYLWINETLMSKELLMLMLLILYECILLIYLMDCIFSNTYNAMIAYNSMDCKLSNIYNTIDCIFINLFGWCMRDSKKSIISYLAHSYLTMIYYYSVVINIPRIFSSLYRYW